MRLFSGCLAHIYDVNFPDNSEVATIPYAQGSYYFEVTAGPKTRTSFEDRLWSFEYRVLIDNAVFDQQMVNIGLPNEDIHEGDVFKVEFIRNVNRKRYQKIVAGVMIAVSLWLIVSNIH